MAMQDLHLDFETYCELDLKKVGIAMYVQHPSFRVLCTGVKVLCAGWKSLGAGGWTSGGPGPEITQLIESANVQVHAWNAAFEAAVLEKLGIKPGRPLSCTMQRAMAYGLPGKLEAAGAAVGAPIQKSASGHKLMIRLSRPDKDGNPPQISLLELEELGRYCQQDAESEECVSDVIPRFSTDEEELSRLDAMMNRQGFYIDRPRVGFLKAAALIAEQDDNARAKVLTNGAVDSPGTQTARLLTWFQANGLTAMESVDKEAIADARTVPDLMPGVREMLEIRARTAKGSTKKLQRMLDMSTFLLGQCCYQFQFVGAGRTGRWSGRGIQPQNLPRIPKGFDPDAFTNMAMAAAGSTIPCLLDVIAPAPVLDCVSWSLRSCIMGPAAAVLWGFDFSQIEARVLAWLAGQEDVLQVFRSGEDIYVWAASEFGSDNRQLGKVLILALGFGMGATKLQETAWAQYGVVMSAATAEAFKNAWRQRNSKIVDFWYEMEYAAKGAIMRRGRVFAVGGSGIAFVCTARTLQMRLPSGRVLYYHKPRLDSDGSITYWGVELNQWREIRTYGGKLAENATQAAARDVMAEAMLRIYRRMGLVPMMTVHDEIVYALANGSDASEYERLALESPQWAGGLPIAGEYKIMSRYGVKL